MKPKENLNDIIEENPIKEESRTVSNLDSDNYALGRNSPFVSPYDLSIQRYLKEIKEYIDLFSSKNSINLFKKK